MLFCLGISADCVVFVSVHLQLCMCVCVCNVPCVCMLRIVKYHVCVCYVLQCTMCCMHVAECTFEWSKGYIFLSAVATKQKLCGMQIIRMNIYGMHA